MPLDLYLAFVAATAILIIIPGPIVTFVIATSLAQGTRAGLTVVGGSSSAMVVHMLVVGLGMTSVLGLLAQWFEILRWLGAGYLIFLGIQAWRARAQAANVGAQGATGGAKLYWRGFLVSVTNPKSLFFYAAFFPQFIDPTAPMGPQLAILCTTFLIIGLVLDSCYALLAGRARRLATSPRGAIIRARVSGTLLIGAGLGLALARRGG